MKPHKERLMLKTRQSSEKLVKLIFLIDRYFFPQPSLKILSLKNQGLILSTLWVVR